MPNCHLKLPLEQKKKKKDEVPKILWCITLIIYTPLSIFQILGFFFPEYKSNIYSLYKLQTLQKYKIKQTINSFGAYFSKLKKFSILSVFSVVFLLILT